MLFGKNRIDADEFADEMKIDHMLPPVWIHGAGFEAAGAHGIQPVSYTHLRAHETVLDIVCRLLLEKKKSPPPPPPVPPSPYTQL